MIGAPQDKIVAAFGFAGFRQTDRFCRKQCSGGLDQAFWRARFELEFCLAHLIFQASSTQHPFIQCQLEIALVGVQLARRARDHSLELSLERGCLERLLDCTAHPVILDRADVGFGLADQDLS